MPSSIQLAVTPQLDFSRITQNANTHSQSSVAANISHIQNVPVKPSTEPACNNPSSKCSNVRSVCAQLHTQTQSQLQGSNSPEPQARAATLNAPADIPTGEIFYGQHMEQAKEAFLSELPADKKAEVKGILDNAIDAKGKDNVLRFMQLFSETKNYCCENQLTGESKDKAFSDIANSLVKLLTQDKLRNNSALGDNSTKKNHEKFAELQQKLISMGSAEPKKLGEQILVNQVWPLVSAYFSDNADPHEIFRESLSLLDGQRDQNIADSAKSRFENLTQDFKLIAVVLNLLQSRINAPQGDTIDGPNPPAAPNRETPAAPAAPATPTPTANAPGVTYNTYNYYFGASSSSPTQPANPTTVTVNPTISPLFNPVFSPSINGYPAGDRPASAHATETKRVNVADKTLENDGQKDIAQREAMGKSVIGVSNDSKPTPFTTFVDGNTPGMDSTEVLEPISPAPLMNHKSILTRDRSAQGDHVPATETDTHDELVVQKKVSHQSEITRSTRVVTDSISQLDSDVVLRSKNSNHETGVSTRSATITANPIKAEINAPETNAQVNNRVVPPRFNGSATTWDSVTPYLPKQNHVNPPNTRTVGPAFIGGMESPNRIDQLNRRSSEAVRNSGQFLPKMTAEKTSSPERESHNVNRTRVIMPPNRPLNNPTVQTQVETALNITETDSISTPNAAHTNLNAVPEEHPESFTAKRQRFEDESKGRDASRLKPKNPAPAAVDSDRIVMSPGSSSALSGYQPPRSANK
ncbi:hypothetical protein ACQ4OC_14515 [Yersinia sp. J1]|uniref:hypothetical protein n=1 Tax=Yersinia sp. J1 TaxID=3424774 RepID=UPI003D36E0BB